MNNNRCPYCGEIIANHKFSLLHVFTRFSKRCRFCGNRFRLHYPKIILTVLPLGLYYVVRNVFPILRELKVVDVLMIIISLCIATYIAAKVPLQKYRLGDFFTSYDADYAVKCKITWSPTIRFCNRADFLSGYIFPVCFHDESDIPISQVLCTVFQKVRHYRYYTTGMFEFVRGDAPKELLQPGNRFSIFSDRHIIAEGTITDVELYEQ